MFIDILIFLCFFLAFLYVIYILFKYKNDYINGAKDDNIYYADAIKKWAFLYTNKRKLENLKVDINSEEAINSRNNYYEKYKKIMKNIDFLVSEIDFKKNDAQNSILIGELENKIIFLENKLEQLD